MATRIQAHQVEDPHTRRLQTRHTQPAVPAVGLHRPLREATAHRLLREEATVHRLPVAHPAVVVELARAVVAEAEAAHTSAAAAVGVVDTSAAVGAAADITDLRMFLSGPLRWTEWPRLF
jgi:hypothetical protein